MREADGAREVGDDLDRAAQNGDEHELATFVVLADLVSELRDPGRQLRAREVDVADPRVGDQVRWLSPYFCARRSKARR